LKIGVVVLGTLLALVATLVLFGVLTPRRHTARVRLRLSRNPSEAWHVIADLAAWPAWNADAREVVRVSDVNDHATWRVTDSHGHAIPYEIVHASAPADGAPGRLVTRIADDGLPFGGSWTWTVEPDGAGSTVTIVEDGVIRNVIFRALARTMFGYTTTQKRALSALAAHFREAADTTETWEHVE